MRELCEMITKKGDRIGSRAIKSITPRGADKIYETSHTRIEGSKGLRAAEKIVLLCRKAWRVVHRLIREFQQGRSESLARRVTMKTRVKLTKPAATREQVYMFAHGCIERGEVRLSFVLSGSASGDCGLPAISSGPFTVPGPSRRSESSTIRPEL